MERRTYQLFLAIERGDLPMVRKLVSEGADINREEGAWTPLTIAIVRKDPAIVSFLIEHGAKMVPKEGKPALMAAIYDAESKEMVELLLKHGARPDVADPLLGSPLKWACISAIPDIVELIVRGGGKGILEQKDSLNRTPLHWAAVGGSAEVARYLLSVGVRSGSDLHEAIVRGDAQKVKELVEADREALARKDEADWMPLHWATALGQGEIARYLINTGSPVHPKLRRVDTPLELAAKHADTATMRLLLEKIGRLDGKNDPGSRRAILDAARRGFPDVVELLLAAGADPDSTDPMGGPGDTPLHRGVYCGDRKVVEVLLKHGASIDKQDNIGATPLYQAVWLRKIEIARLLLERGANPRIKTMTGESALDIVARKKDPESARLLELMTRNTEANSSSQPASR